MTIAIPEFAWTELPLIGDEIAVITNDGSIAGSAVYTGGTMVITIWGNDSETKSFNGLEEGAELSFVYWNSEANMEGRLDISLESGENIYTNDGISVATKLSIIEELVQSELLQNTPNPVRDNTEFSFYINTECDVTISIFNLLGEKVEIISLGNLEAGDHTVDYNASDLSVGTYLYKIEAGSFVSTKQMNVIK